MTLKDFYDRIGGDYDDAIRRLMSDRIAQKFLLRFLDDPSMGELLDAVESHDREKAFVAVHTLKGVAANLALTSLQKCASELTEQLRDRKHDADSELLNAVKEKYSQIISAIDEIQKSLG